MSVSKWRYTEACDGRPCVGDCDFCSFDPEEPELCVPYEGERRNYDGKEVTVLKGDTQDDTLDRR